jgi:hypothetical protein
MVKSISTESNPANQVIICQLLESAPSRLAADCDGIAEAQARHSAEAGERTLVEIVAHLLNVEARSSEIIFHALILNEPLVPAIHPEHDWGALAHYDRLQLADLLVYFRLRRAVLIPVLSGLSAKQWDRRIREPGKQRQESVYWRARGLALHEQEHLAEIETRFGQGEP